jgi:signal transduction histidine kinase
MLGGTMMNLKLIVNENSNIIAFPFVVHNMRKYEETQEKMQFYRKRLQSLAVEMSIIEERQRRYIAQILHDNIGQSLALCNLQLASMISSCSSDEFKNKISQVQKTINSIIKETRSLTSEIVPPALYEIGLGRAIKRLTEKISKENNLRIQYYEHGESVHFVGDILGLLFQVTRELFINIVKHAQAHLVIVHLRYMETEVQIDVTDDGIGFDSNYVLSNSEKTNSFGLFSISERIQYLGGSVKIISEPGRGTEIALSCPYKPNISNSIYIGRGEI